MGMVAYCRRCRRRRPAETRATAIVPCTITTLCRRRCDRHRRVVLVKQQQQQQATTANYVTCIMESMGIRYRPEQSMATVVDQSLAELTTDGYGAGSYWKSVFATTTSASDRRNSAALQSLPVLATLGNTTRIYPFLHQTALDAQQIVSRRHKRSVNRALYNRDAVLGILPEVDDCEEAVTACWDLRDSYAPPEGSGLVVDEEGSYFVDG